MKRSLIALALGLLSSSASAQVAPAAVTLTRLDCGTSPTPSDVTRFSDTWMFNGLKVQLAVSCYLIRHGDDYMIWDTGNPVGTAASSPKVPLVDLLKQLNITPAQIKYVGISHYHGDHTGQVGAFPQSTLLIGKGDWDMLTNPAMSSTANPTNFAAWVSGGSKVEPQAGDKDVFADGSVIVLNTPGHTPGHHSLLVKLKDMGNVLITGDLSHFHENYDGNGVPTFNTNRSETLASLERFKAIAKNLNATVIIQHDARDIGKLPTFPGGAR